MKLFLSSFVPGERAEWEVVGDLVLNELSNPSTSMTLWRPSAAPILDDTERSGVAADHRNMCKFEGKGSPGFTTVVEALRRYDATRVIKGRNQRAREILRDQDWHRATELVQGGSEPSSAGSAVGPRLLLNEMQQRFLYNDLIRGARAVNEPTG